MTAHLLTFLRLFGLLAIVGVVTYLVCVALPALLRERRRRKEEYAAPFVCPGCYAVGEEPCAAYCIDAEIEQGLAYDRERWLDYVNDYDDERDPDEEGGAT
jgi:hypothetical protein